MVDLLSRLPHRIDYEGVVGNDILISTLWRIDGVPIDFTQPNITCTAYLQLRDGSPASQQWLLTVTAVGQLTLNIEEEFSDLLGPGTFYWSVDIMQDDLLLTTLGGKMTMYVRTKAIEHADA